MRRNQPAWRTSNRAVSCAVLAFTLGLVRLGYALHEDTAEEPVLPARGGPEVALNRKWAEELFPSALGNRLIIAHEDELGDTKMRRCAAGGPLRLGSRTYEHGLGVNSHSIVRVWENGGSHYVVVDVSGQPG
jgi:hypothetical protein